MAASSMENSFRGRERSYRGIHAMERSSIMPRKSGVWEAISTLQAGYALIALAAHSYPLDQTTASLTHLVTAARKRVRGAFSAG